MWAVLPQESFLCPWRLAQHHELQRLQERSRGAVQPARCFSFGQPPPPNGIGVSFLVMHVGFRYSSWLPKSKQKLTIKTKIDAPKRPLTSLFSSLLCAAGLLLCRCPAPSAVLWVLEWSALQFFYQPRCFWIQFSVHLQLVSCRLFAG